VKIEYRMFLVLGIFFAVVAVIYTALTGWVGNAESVGVAGLILVSGLALMIAFYIKLVARRLDPRPEDDPNARISDHEGNQGFYSPWSWWPLPLAAAAAMVFLGMAVGWWVSIIGAGFAVIALIGWVYEYYRGQHAH
jgi:hypothetical protein